jgi:hypothetical protein
MKKFMYDLLLSVCLDERVTTGIFDPSLQEHVDVLVDHLGRKGLERRWICEFVNNMVEGKYPERQAYNREGFLVTFPTPEHKKNALASGDFFQSDPTGGKGGMHLVKKAEPAPTAPEAAPSAPPPPAPEQPAQQQKPAAPAQPAPAKPAPKAPELPAPIATPEAPKPNAPAMEKPSAGVDVPTAPTKYTKTDQQKSREHWRAGEQGKTEYVDPSVEWAHNQKWERTGNGNYYDAQGNLAAVTSLDGKVVPIDDANKERLKVWIKNPENRPEMQARGVGD